VFRAETGEIIDHILVREGKVNRAAGHLTGQVHACPEHLLTPGQQHENFLEFIQPGYREFDKTITCECITGAMISSNDLVRFVPVIRVKFQLDPFCQEYNS